MTAIIPYAPLLIMSSQHLGKRSYREPVILHEWQPFMLKPIDAADLLPLETPSKSPVFKDTYFSQDTFLRRCRKRAGDTFRTSDLPQTIPENTVMTDMASQPDHPYAPMLALFDLTLPMMPLSEKVFPSGDVSAYMNGMRCLDDEILVPSLPPTLAVSLDVERSLLVSRINCSPRLSPAVRLPTVHFPLETEPESLVELAADLGVHYESADRLLPYLPVVDTENAWLLKTLGDLHLYITRKGVDQWPWQLSFDDLTSIRQSCLYCAGHEKALEWLGTFIDNSTDLSGLPESYTKGVRRLLLARYRVLGEPLPPRPSDALAGLTF